MYCKEVLFEKFHLPKCPTENDFVPVSLLSNILHIFTVYMFVSVLMQNKCTVLKHRLHLPHNLHVTF